MLKFALPALLAALAAAAQASPAWTAATVVKADLAKQRLVLKHEAIVALDMPPMKMAFRVTNPEWLNLTATQAVRVQVERLEQGYTVTALEAGPVPVKPAD